MGVIFYSWDRLPYNHVLWHFFVLAGGAAHAAVTLVYLLPH